MIREGHAEGILEPRSDRIGPGFMSSRGRMRLLAGAALLFLFPAATFSAGAADCSREAFSKIVSDVSAELAALNAAQKAGFHEKLQLLKARQGWADGDFVTKATPFVQDAKIAEFDQSNKSLLARVPQLGAPASLAGVAPSLPSGDDRNCAMLQELSGLMTQLVANTRAKWAYMLGKVDVALEDARQAKADR